MNDKVYAAEHTDDHQQSACQGEHEARAASSNQQSEQLRRILASHADADDYLT